MAIFRKKPVLVEAWLAKDVSSAMSKDWNLGLIPECIKTAYEKGGWVFLTNGEVHIPTLEGTMIASPDDYIIRGVNGEFYPCKPDIFEKTYSEEVDTDDSSTKVWAFEGNPKDLLQKLNASQSDAHSLVVEDFEQLIRDWEKFCNNENFIKSPFFLIEKPTTNTGDFKTRLIEEQQELAEKLYALISFNNSDRVTELSSIQQSLLHTQENVMTSYNEVLQNRIRHLDD